MGRVCGVEAIEVEVGAVVVVVAELVDSTALVVGGVAGLSFIGDGITGTVACLVAGAVCEVVGGCVCGSDCD